MSRRALCVVSCVLVASAIGGTLLVRAAHAARASTPLVATAAGFSERPKRDLQIAVWHQALDADPHSALVQGQLAALHLQRAREGGGWDDYITAETFARASLAQRTFRNAATASTLVAILLAQHRFTEARDVAHGLAAGNPDVAEYRATLGEVFMELGEYRSADSLFATLWNDRGTLTIAARLSRWLEINGHVTEARRVLETARNDAVTRRDVSRETQAWFALRLGDLELRSGRLRAAERAFRDGLAIEPGDPRLCAAMARLNVARGEPRDAIAWGGRAISLQLDPATIGLVGDAYTAIGDSAQAHEYFEALQTAVGGQPGAYHRAWSLHLLDHNLHVDEVLVKARDELRERKDIYGWDVYAWALEKSGQRAAAQAAMREALRLGTSDPLLARHARAIGVATSPGAGD
jgi:tetratricopeptide (TPR) repeat protein